MARYIDADELMEKIKKCEFDITGCGIMYHAGGVQSAINTQRTADVVPKSEVERLEKSALPCKIGDTVWVIRKYHSRTKAVQGKVSEMYYIDGMRLCIIVRNVAGGEWGKTVFATKEEAQAAIDERKRG